MTSSNSAAGSHSFDVVDSEILVEAPIIALRRDRVRMPGGRIAAREIVEHFGAVAVVALDDDGRICLLRQWRQTAQDRLVELPAGILDVADEDPLVAARRELAEEAGVAAERWSVLTDIFTSPGFAEETVRVYLAEGLSDADRPEPEDEEADMTESWVDLAEAADMVLRGEVVNAIAVAGILAAHVTLTEGRERR
ncbi:MAG: NUDIX hydrolase, partial [Corynebacterium sp.]|nr:NUDIX hydrolase [Corynebacterium sp.]